MDFSYIIALREYLSSSDQLEFYISASVLLLLFSLLLLYKASLRRQKSNYSFQNRNTASISNFRMTEEIQGLVEKEPALDALLSERSRSQASSLVSTLSKVISREIAGEIVRLLPLSILLSSFLCALAFSYGVEPSERWLLAIVCCTLVIQVFAVGNFFTLQSFSALPSLILTVGISIVLPGYLVLVLFEPPLLIGILPLVLFCFLSQLPLRFKDFFVIALFGSALFVSIYQIDGLYFAIVNLALAMSFGILAELRRRQLVYQGISLNLPRVLALYESTSLLLLSRWCTRLVVNGSRTELILDDGRRVPDPLFETAHTEAFSEVNARMPRLVEWFVQLDREGGVIELSQAPDQVRKEWELCLGERSAGVVLAFATLEVVLRGEKRVMYLCSRMPRFARLYGKDVIFRNFFALAKLVDARQRITQLHFRSSDLVAAIQNTLDRRERDLKEIIHYSNNMAHEAFLVEERATTLGLTDEHTVLLRQLCQAIASLSSDLRVLWDFNHRPSAFQIETISCQSLREEVEDFIFLQKQRGTQRIEYSWELADDQALEVPGYHVLLAIMRQILRGYYFSTVSERVLMLQVEQIQPQSVRIIFSGAPHIIPQHGYSKSIPEASSVLTIRDELITVIQSFCERLGLTLHMNNGMISFSIRLTEMKVVRVGNTEQSDQHSRKQSWVLFLDDNPNARKLYDQIGKQLGVDYLLAESTESAREFIESHGMPLLIVSDEELGVESGSRFIRAIETEYGESVRGFLVTGQEPSPGLRSRLPETMKILSKPIGRKKLLEYLEQATRELQRMKVRSNHE